MGQTDHTVSFCMCKRCNMYTVLLDHGRAENNGSVVAGQDDRPNQF